MNDIAEELIRIADICDWGDKPHWATAMRAGAEQISIWQPELESLRAEVESLRKDAERYRWLEKLFDRKWNGVVGSGSAYHYDLIGPWRHTVQRLAGESLGDAIDAAMTSNASLSGPPLGKD